MRTTIQSTMKCVVMAACVLLAACTQDVYEPEPDPVPPTPEKPEPVLPNDFNQSTATIRQVTFTVEVNDEYNGQFDYVVSFYDKNPFSVKDAKPLYTGVANRNKPLLRTVTLPQALTTIYVMQTDPRKGKSVKTLSLDPATTNLMCDFKPAPATKAETKAALRNGEDQYVPSKDATTMTMEELESMMDSSNGNVSLSAGEFILTGESYMGVNNLNLKGEVKLFVRGKLTFNSINTDGNSTIIIEDSGELDNVNADNLYANGNGSKIVIKRGGKLYKENAINTPSIKLYGYNIENYSTILVDGIGTGAGYSDTNGSPISIVNYGEIHATNILMYAGGSIENHCLIDIKDQLYLGKSTKLSLDTQTMLKAKSLEANDISCEMSKYSIFRIFGRSYGEGEAILKGNNTIECKDADFALVDFNVMNLASGKLELSGNIHLLGTVFAGDQFDGNISSTGGAMRVNQAGSITIPGNSTNPQGDNACTGEGNQGSTEEPSNPDYPIVTPNGPYSTFAMEDNWPAFGDYDMNDLVLGIRSELSLDPSNNVTKMTLYIDLIAVGATKILGAGIQFEKLTAAQVGLVTSPGNIFANNGYFDLSNGLEPNSEAVLPLFDDAHWLLSSTQQREVMNTSNSSKTYYQTRNLVYTLEFNTPVSADDLDISNLNFFIVNGGTAQKRSEVHLAGYQPTDRVKGDTNNYIATDPENPDKTMWGFIIPTKFMYAAENATINSAYPEFGAWSTSAGNQSKDWYEHPENAHIYHQPKTE